jgi:hypothetical protein
MPYRLIPDQIPRKCQSPLVIPCKFSAVTYSERHSATHSVARRVLPKSLGNKDLHLPGVTGSECQRAGTASVIPLVIGSIPIRQARCRRHCRARAFPRQSSPDAVCCKGVRFGARVIRDTTRHQPSRGKHDSWAPVHRHRARRTVRSWKFSCGAPMSSTKCRSAVAPHCRQRHRCSLRSVRSVRRLSRVSGCLLPQWLGISSRWILRRSISSQGGM